MSVWSDRRPRVVDQRLRLDRKSPGREAEQKSTPGFATGRESLRSSRATQYSRALGHSGVEGEARLAGIATRR